MNIYKKIILALFLIIFIFVFSILIQKPSHDRTWEEDTKILPEITIENNLIKVKNIRDYKFDQNGVVSKNYFDEVYDADKITKVWFFVEPFSKWDGVAHTMFSFDFEDGKTISISVEARREEGEKYNAVAGLLNKFELIYVWGSEYDLVTRRTMWQKYDMYMFPLKTSPEFRKKLFIDLAETTQKISTQPQFYNTITTNCTNTLADSANRAVPGTIKWNWSRILPGYAEEFLYKNNFIEASGTLDEIKEKYFVKDLTKEIKQDENFSKNLRARLE